MTNPKKWYQWVLLYPTVALAVLGSIPTTFETIRSTRLDTKWGESSRAIEQHGMWQRNFNCTKDLSPVTVQNAASITISALVCPSGDILVSGKRPGDITGNFTWVSLDVVLAGESTSILRGLVPSAIAETRIPIETNWVVLCQRWVDQRTLYTRIASGGFCYDRYIDTYTNSLLSSTMVNCNSRCN